VDDNSTGLGDSRRTYRSPHAVVSRLREVLQITVPPPSVLLAFSQSATRTPIMSLG
jgi:hypothetical protein